MNAIIYPISLRRNFRQHLAGRLTNDDLRRSPPEGTDTCICGHTVIAPNRSTHAPNEVVNHWECSACGRRWETTAPYDGGVKQSPL
jgi:hypothetical protein